MKKKKKISVSYLERESKKDGKNGYVRIVHDGTSTMFKIGTWIDFEGDSKTWFANNKELLTQLLEKERDIIGIGYSVTGFHQRWEKYNDLLSSVFTEENILPFISFLLSDVLSKQECDEIFETSLDEMDVIPMSINIVYQLLSTDFGKERNNEVIDSLKFDSVIFTVAFEVFSIIEIQKNNNTIKALDYITNPSHVTEIFSSFWESENDIHRKIISNKPLVKQIDYIVKKLSIQPESREECSYWMRKQYRKTLKAIYIFDGYDVTSQENIPF